VYKVLKQKKKVIKEIFSRVKKVPNSDMSFSEKLNLKKGIYYIWDKFKT